MTTSKSTKHVGSIDILKFLLCIVIVILHCGQKFGGDNYHLRMGGIAVEAFFIISGYLSCVSAAKNYDKPDKTIGPDTMHFIKRKLKEILIPYIVLIIIYIICWFINSGAEILALEGKKALLLNFFAFIPNLMLLSMAGISQDNILMEITWYISAMFIVLLITYPLIRKFKRNYTLIAAPFISLLLMGFMYNCSSIYKGSSNFLIFMPQGLFRAFIAINLGCITYEFANRLKKAKLTYFSRILLTLSVILLCLITFFVMEYGDEKNCYSLVLLFPFLILILFSSQMAGSRFFDNKVSTYLGRSSIYIYLYHIAVRQIILTAEIDISYTQATVVILTASFAMFVVTDLSERLIKKIISNMKHGPSSLFIRKDL